MQIDFNDKELQVIEIINPGFTAEETCNKILRDWFDSNVARMPSIVKTSDEMVDDILATNEAQIAQMMPSGGAATV